MGLSAFMVSAIDASRQISAGLISVSSGILSDMYQHRRGQMLAIAMLIIGLGYFVVGLVDNLYVLVIIAVMVGNAVGSCILVASVVMMVTAEWLRRGRDKV